MLDGKFYGKIPLHEVEDNSKMKLREMKGKVWVGLYWLMQMLLWRMLQMWLFHCHDSVGWN